MLTLWRGNIHLTVPMLFAIGFIFTFINGGLTGLFLGNVTVDLPLSDTYFVVAHFHMVMGVSPILVVFGAIYHWYPEDHRPHAERHARQVPFLDHVPRHLCDLPTRCTTWASWACRAATTRIGNTDFIPQSAHALNDAITIAALIVGAVQLVFLYNLIWSLFQGQAGRRQPLARDHARMADPGHAAEARQLGPEAAGRLSLGLRLQRAGRGRGLHPAERAAEPESRRPRGRTGRVDAAGAPRIEGLSHAVMAPLLVLAALMAMVVWWLVRQTLNAKPWMERARSTTIGGDGAIVAADDEGRARRVPGGRHLVVRAVHQRLLHAHGWATDWATADRCRRCCGSTRRCWF